MCDRTKYVPQVGNPRRGNPTADSDRVQAPVIGADLMDFGGGQTHVLSRVDHIDPQAVSGNKKEHADLFERRKNLWKWHEKLITDLLRHLKHFGPLSVFVQFLTSCSADP